MSEDNVARIRALNDAFRKEVPSRQFGKTYVTDGVNSLGPEKVATLLALVRDFDAFNAGSDPHHEHDFGSIASDGERFFWKIDYYAKGDLNLGSEDPSDPAKTQRVMTIMLASEY